MKNTKDIEYFSLPYRYYEWIVGARAYFMEYDFKTDDNLLSDFIQISQNLDTFNIEVDDYQLFARDVKYFQSWATHDQNYIELLSLLKTESDKQTDTFIKDKKPIIYCTYHTGSYRFINVFLLSKKIPFVLITDDNYIKTQGNETIENVKKTLFKLYGNDSYFNFEIINAEEPTSILKIARALKNGYSALFYIDGNTGVKQFEYNPDKLLSIEFLNKNIYARKGIAYLSYKFNIPVIPVISFRNQWSEFILSFKKVIFPNKETDLENYCYETTVYLFKILEEVVVKYPSQWEGWFYVNKFLPTENNSIKKKAKRKTKNQKYLTLNTDRYHIVRLSNIKILFDKKELSSIEMSEILFTILDYAENNNIETEKDLSLGKINYTKESIKELIDKEILTEL